MHEKSQNDTWSVWKVSKDQEGVAQVHARCPPTRDGQQMIKIIIVIRYHMLF